MTAPFLPDKLTDHNACNLVVAHFLDRLIDHDVCNIVVALCIPDRLIDHDVC